MKKGKIRKRMSAEERRTQLLQTAVSLFSQHGFDGTTTKSIAEAAGVSEGIIFQHFSTKEELYAGILEYKARESGIEEWHNQLREYAGQEDDRALVRSIVERILQSDRQNPEFKRLMLQAALKGHPLTKIMARRVLPFHQFLCDYIANRQKKGAFTKCDPNVVVTALVSMPSWYGLTKHLLDMNNITLSDHEIAEHFTDLILEGLYTSYGRSPKKGKTRE